MEEKRGRPATIIQEEAPRKYTRVYEDEYAIETWTFDIDTQGGEPAKLTVVRRQPPDMYYATATVGSFGERYTEAERIVREFRLAMRRYGALKRPS